ncbi:hypothetical protein DXH47_01815 [Levilactobacillus suantsaii]|uniref:Uncharacterized protein n=1 Tax=Levilactobacillus suantsaii TaxID=2292255 RepID=A0A4Q0VLP8_9LACO|nr:hypothetical protein DXH47_01815 [Levilactobacillus suantsaii]
MIITSESFPQTPTKSLRDFENGKLTVFDVRGILFKVLFADRSLVLFLPDMLTGRRGGHFN